MEYDLRIAELSTTVKYCPTQGQFYRFPEYKAPLPNALVSPAAGSFAALFALMLVAGFFIYREKRRRRLEKECWKQKQDEN